MQVLDNPTRTYLQRLFTDTGYHLEDLLEAMGSRDDWQETVREIQASGMI